MGDRSLYLARSCNQLVLGQVSPIALCGVGTRETRILQGGPQHSVGQNMVTQPGNEDRGGLLSLLLLPFMAVSKES